MLKILYIIFLIFIVSSQIYAETIVSSSIEWITCQSDVIITGKIENMVVANPSPLIAYNLITVKIDKVLKGNITDRKLVFELNSSDTKTIKENLNKSDGSFVIFLKKTADTEKKYIPTSSQSPLFNFESRLFARRYL